MKYGREIQSSLFLIAIEIEIENHHLDIKFHQLIKNLKYSKMYLFYTKPRNYN